MIIEKQTHTSFVASVNADVDQVAEQLTTISMPAYMYVLVEAAAGNGGTVYVGHSSAVSASNGWPLAAGENVQIPVDDPSKIWVIGSADNQAVKWLAV